MAKQDSITIDDRWFELKDLALPPGVTVAEIEKILTVKPMKISLEVILPKGSSARGFDYNKNAEVKKFRTTLESKVAATLAEIVGEDTPEDGKKALDSLNSHLEKAAKAFRVTLRTAVAKQIGNGCKPDDLMTAGSIQFEKFEFLLGVKDDGNDPSKMLDLSKALKRVNKEQHLGIAWKGKDIVLSVRLRKQFLQADLKELRLLLPKKASRTNLLVVGQLIAYSKTNVTVNFKEGTKNIPKKKLFQIAFKKQTNSQVVVTVGRIVESAAPMSDKKSKKKKGKAEKDDVDNDETESRKMEKEKNKEAKTKKPSPAEAKPKTKK
jgi:hypothetical protein